MQAPECSCGEEEWIELHRSSNNIKLRCGACGDTVTVPNIRPRTLALRLIISEGPESFQDSIDVERDEEVRIGDEFDLHGRRLLVTGIEDHQNRRLQKAPVDEVSTLLAKRFDHVIVKFAINEGEKTRSSSLTMTPEDVVEVGSKIQLPDGKVVVKTIKTDANKTVRRGQVLARHIRRVFCDPYRPRWGRGPRRNPQRR